MGAARPAGASQPFLPACFLIDTAAYISRARCCSSEAWRLAKPSQTDSCAASSVSGLGCVEDARLAAAVAAVLPSGSARIQPLSSPGTRLALGVRLVRGVSSFSRAEKTRDASRLKAGFGSLSGRIAAQRCSCCCLAAPKTRSRGPSTFRALKVSTKPQRALAEWTLPHRRRRHRRGRAPTPSPADRRCASSCAASATAI